MSLSQLAQTIQSRGRGDDSVLIHMTPREVQGLQALAMSQGGSLTTNPDTGLPEAGFLSSILPTLIGAGLAATGVGAPLAALMVGGGATLLSGSLQKGLMAGLGAYGGAGIGAGLTGAGAGAAQAGAQAAAQPLAQTTAALGAPAAAAANSQAAMLAAQNAGFGAEGLASLQQAAGTATGFSADAGRLAGSAVTNTAAADATKAFTAQPWYDQLRQGASAAFQNPASALESMGGTKKAIQYGLAAAAPVMADMAPTAAAPETDNERYLYQFDRPRRDPNEGYTGPYSGERQYFGDSSLTRIGMAEGGSPEDKFQMTGESKAAYDYLMGRAPVSPGAMRAQEMAAMPAPRPQAAPMAQADRPSSGAQMSAFRGKDSPGRSPFADLLVERGSSSAAPTYNFDPRTGQLVMVQRPEPELSPQDAYVSSGYAKGGIAGLAKGGFVVPADVVSMLGEGSTDAGIRALKAKFGAVESIKGPGTGQSDSIPTTIEGKQRARVADGEAYIPPEVVQKHGGAKKFYAMLDRVRTASQGHTKQQRRVNPTQVMA